MGRLGLALSLEPVFVQIGGGSVAAIEQVELGGRFGEFVVEEVLRGKALTVVEILSFPIRSYSLLQPDPGQHDVPDGFEVQRRIGQRGAGVAADLALQACATLSLGQPYWLELGERTVSVLSRAQRANDTIAVARPAADHR
jgi:hypothetical protein